LDISIVLVSWNTCEILRNCLESVYSNPGHLKVEVFVVDNASDDGSADMVGENYPQVHLIRNTKNVGFAAANNQAIRLAIGRHILLLNSDTVVLDDVLEKSVAYMDQHPHVGVFGCRVLNPDRTVQSTCFQYPSLLNLFLKTTGLFHLKWPRIFGREHLAHWQRDSERDVRVVTGCYMLVRREAIDQVGLLDESFFFYGEETDWCKRFAGAGWKVRFSPVGEIIHIGNASGRQLRADRDLLLAEGIIRFHQKHSGPVSATMVWLMIWFFVVVRVVFWSFVSILGRKSQFRERRDHFWAILKNYNVLWKRLSW